MFTLQQKLDAIDREVKYRVRVYARRIAQGKMTRELAEFQVAIMREIAADYHNAIIKRHGEQKELL